MQSKKIFLAIISLGLIFAPALFAQDMTGFQRQMMEKMRQQTMQKSMQQTQGGQNLLGEAQPPGFAAIDLSGDGRKLFNDPALGTNGKSCGSCHQEGQKPLDGRKVDHHMVAFVQYCYEHAIRGVKVIDKEKLNKIMAYFNSLEKKSNPAGAIAPAPMMPTPSMSTPLMPNRPNHQGGEEDW